MSIDGKAFNYNELIQKIIQTNAIAEEGETLISLLETAGILAAKRNPIKTNIIVYSTDDLGYPESNDTLGAAFHYLEFDKVVIPGSTVRDTAVFDNHFKFICGRSGRYDISVNLNVEFQDDTLPGTRKAGEVAKAYFTITGLKKLEVSILKNGAPEKQKFTGSVRCYSVANLTYNYADVCTVGGSAVFDLAAGDVIEPIANLLTVAQIAPSNMMITGNIAIHWIDNHKLIE